MLWTTPALEVVKMDAEVGSYQVDEEPAQPLQRQHWLKGDELDDEDAQPSHTS